MVRNPRVFFVALLLFVFLAGCMPNGRAVFPLPLATQAWYTPTPAPTVSVMMFPAPTLSPEMLANREQTNGVLFVGVLIVLVIIGGSLSAALRK